MKQTARNFARDARGQSLVEFALVLPMLLVIMFMITEFGRALFQYNVLEQATREGARAAVVASRTSAQATADARMNVLLGAANLNDPTLQRTFQIIDNYNGTGTTVVRVRLQRPFNWIINGNVPTSATGTGTVGRRGLTLAAETVMKSETF
jgi:Flp pilus assembly protein TadG